MPPPLSETSQNASECNSHCQLATPLHEGPRDSASHERAATRSCLRSSAVLHAATATAARHALASTFYGSLCCRMRCGGTFFGTPRALFGRVVEVGFALVESGLVQGLAFR